MGKMHRKSKRIIEINDALFTVSEKEAARLDFTLNKKWFSLFWWVIIAGLTILAIRAIDLAVVRGGFYRSAAEGNSVRTIPILAPRGKIYDRFGTELVTNVPTVNVTITSHDLPSDPVRRTAVVQNAATLLHLGADQIATLLALLESATAEPILLKENVSPEETLLLLGKTQELPGITLEKSAKRNYADSAIFSHVVGYDGRVGKEDITEYPA